MAKTKPARKHVDMSEPLSSQPWWVKTIVWVGAPAAAAAYLLYFVIGTLSARLDTMSSQANAQTAQMTELVRQLNQQTEQAWVTQGTLSRICINTARTEVDKIACVSISRKPQ